MKQRDPPVQRAGVPLSRVEIFPLWAWPCHFDGPACAPLSILGECSLPCNSWQEAAKTASNDNTFVLLFQPPLQLGYRWRFQLYLSDSLIAQMALPRRS